MISLDGGSGEGGGQIVRTALALSCLTGKPFEVNNIRKGRCEPGLKAQHLSCVLALKQMCDAQTEGAELASTCLRFEPKPLKPKSLEIDLGTAGSITLFMQSILPAIILGKRLITITVTGGTDVKWSMPIDYFKHVLTPQLAKWADIEVIIHKRGYYPQGQGKVEFRVKPRYSWDTKHKAPILDLIDQGKLIHIRGVSHASKDLEKDRVADRQATAAKFILKKLNAPINILSEYSDAPSTGCGIAAWGIFGPGGAIDLANPVRIGSDCLGEKTKRAEEIGIECANRLINEIQYQAPVDEYLADNLAPFIAIFGGKYRCSKITNHLITNIEVISKFWGPDLIKVDPVSKIVESKGLETDLDDQDDSQDSIRVV